jgi:hypothetical protein
MPLTPGEIADSLVAAFSEHKTAVLQELAEEESEILHAANMVRALSPQESTQYKPVVYHSQWDSDAAKFRSDCGPACLHMLLEYHGVKNLTTDELATACGMSPANPYTTGPGLVEVARRYGVAMRAVEYQAIDYFAQRTPCIVLVHYGDIPNRQDMNYTGGHFVVMISAGPEGVFYHDPDWQFPRRDEGAFRRLGVEIFKRAIDNCALDDNPSGYGVVYEK